MAKPTPRRRCLLLLGLQRCAMVATTTNGLLMQPHTLSSWRCPTPKKRTTTPELRQLSATLSSMSEPPPPPVPNFCANCGAAAMELQVPPNEDRLRAVCKSCGHIVYTNPKVVVSCVVWTDDDRCLLGKRAIEPRKGTWGIPQGFLEHGETTRQAAVREVREETGAMVDSSSLQLRAVYNLPGSVQIVYEARVSGVIVEQELVQSTHESAEVALVSMDEIPYQELCFPTVQWAIEHCLALRHDAGGGPQRIQQWTKVYDAAMEQWRVIEDDKTAL